MYGFKLPYLLDQKEKRAVCVMCNDFQLFQLIGDYPDEIGTCEMKHEANPQCTRGSETRGVL